MDRKPCTSMNILFGDFCNFLNKLLCTRDKQEKYKLLSSYFKNYRQKGEVLLQENSSTNVILFPIIRLFLPELDRQRGPYGLKEHAIAKKLSKVLHLPLEEENYLLKDWKKNLNTNTRDFSDAVTKVLKKYAKGHSKLSVYEINEALDVMADIHSSKITNVTMENHLEQIFRSLGPIEYKWFTRLILKEVKVGIGHEKILQNFHPDAPQLFNNNNSLLQTCQQLHNKPIGTTKMEITMFNAFQPMLSMRCDAKVFKKVVTDSKLLYVETKFDGERFQMHMQNNNFKYFSRRGFDYTDHFGSSYRSGSLTPLLEGLIQSNINSIILDGEMMGWNEKTKEFGSKGMHFDVKKLSDNAVHRACFCVFDILYLNNEIVTDKPLVERQALLKDVLTPKEGVLYISKVMKINARKDLINALNKTVDNDEEGVVFKLSDSKYLCNSRNGGWWKLKLEYFSDTMNDLDVLIVGGYYGESRNRKKISEFLVGVIDNSKDERKYLSFAKMTTGLNDNELSELESKIGNHWILVENNEDHKKFGIEWGKEVPHFWIKPENSCVLEVRGTELITHNSKDFVHPYTLRFPRIQKVRLDKPFYDAITVEELDSLTSGGKSVTKLNKRHLSLEDILYSEPKRRKTATTYKPPSIPDVEVKSKLLEGFEIYVLTGTSSWPKEQVQAAIVENGGSVVLYDRPNTKFMLAGDDHLSIKSYRGDKDIVSIVWLKKILKNGKYSMYKRNELIYCCKKTNLILLSLEDKYGDCYLEPVTNEDILEIINDMAHKENVINLMAKEIDDLKDLGLPIKNKKLKDLVVYFDSFIEVNNSETQRKGCTMAEECLVMVNGATIANKISFDTNAVIVDNLSDEERLTVIKGALKNISNTKAIILERNQIRTFFKFRC